MADNRRDSEKPKAETEKKPVETVHLTAEELRKISGGAAAPPPNPAPSPKPTPLRY
jgi:hypothetical protein